MLSLIQCLVQLSISIAPVFQFGFLEIVKLEIRPWSVNFTQYVCLICDGLIYKLFNNFQITSLNGIGCYFIFSLFDSGDI